MTLSAVEPSPGPLSILSGLAWLQFLGMKTEHNGWVHLQSILDSCCCFQLVPGGNSGEYCPASSQERELVRNFVGTVIVGRKGSSWMTQIGGKEGGVQQTEKVLNTFTIQNRYFWGEVGLKQLQLFQPNLVYNRSNS